jgi:hypothetical protein
MSAGVQRVPSGHLDTELRLSGVRGPDGMAFIEVRTVRRDVADVDPEGFHDAGEPVRIPVAYLDLFAQRAHAIAHQLLTQPEAA